MRSCAQVLLRRGHEYVSCCTFVMVHEPQGILEVACVLENAMAPQLAIELSWPDKLESEGMHLPGKHGARMPASNCHCLLLDWVCEVGHMTPRWGGGIAQ